MFLANLLIADFPKLQQYNPSLISILEYTLYKIPGFLELAFPIGIALGTSLSTSRLIRESELVIFKASGISLMRYIYPILGVGIIIGLISFNFMEHVVPEAERKAKSIRAKIASEYTGENIKTETVIKLGKYMAYIGYLERLQDKSIKLGQVFLKESSTGNKTTLITAKEGVYKNNQWSLRNVAVRIFKNDILTTFTSLNQFKFYEPFNVSSIFESTTYGPKNAQQVTAKALSEAIQEGKKRKLNTLNLEVAYYNKYSIPTACVIFALTGPALASGLAKSGPFAGVLLSIILVMAYYNVFVVFTEVVAYNGWFPSILCSWTPNLLFLGIGLILIRKNG